MSISRFITRAEVPNRLFGNIRAGQPELGIYNTPQMQYAADNNNESQNAGAFIPEEETGIFSLGDILADLGRKGVEGFKDVAGRGIASQALGTAGGMILGPLGALAGGILGLTKGGGIFQPSESGKFYNSLTSEGKSTVDRIYGPGGSMSGYNPVSFFGKGVVGDIDNRIGKIYDRKIAQSDFSRKTIQDLYRDREKVMQGILDERNKYTGPISAPRGQTAGVMDDDPFGNDSGPGFGDSMQESVNGSYFD